MNCQHSFIENGELKIETLEGIMTAKAGDWIIRGIAGEYYPCKSDIFEASYILFKDINSSDITESSNTI